jgi:hypothetical protein
MSSPKINGSINIGFAGLLALLFIGLKLLGYVAWPWIWVLAPLWVPLAIVVALVILFAIIAGFVALIKALLD